MHFTFHIAILIYFLKVSQAQLHKCSSDTNPYKICITDRKQYDMSPPSELNTTLLLHEIVSINEDENSITIQAVLINSWEMDPNLTLSKNTNKYVYYIFHVH